jgi:LuxR family quorum-sensing system transcriptional regulator SolR
MKEDKQHISITTANDVKQICAPLFDKTPICYFRYSRTYKNQMAFTLVSNDAWQKFYLEQKFQTKITTSKAFSAGYHLAENLNPEWYKAYHEIMGVKSILYGIKECKDYYESVNFGIKEKQDDYWLNNINLLENFTLYFQDQAASLIKMVSKKNNLVYQGEMDKNFIKQEPKTELIEQIPIKRYFLDHMGINNRLSERETQCLIYLLRGRTAKQTAKELGISPKSVEAHINSIKIKFDCYTRAELFDKAITSGFIGLVKNYVQK